MKPDFDHIKKLFIIHENAGGDTWIAAATQLRTLLPGPLFEKLCDFDDVESEKFERTFREFYSREARGKPTKPIMARDARKSPDDLLPFAGFDNYSLDAWGRPHGVGVQGQRRGPLTAIKQWKPRKGQKPRFIFGYSLYRDGKRVFRSATLCAMARSNAERGPEYAAYWAARGDERLQGDTEVDGATEK
jgi:hypothetical protein